MTIQGKPFLAKNGEWVIKVSYTLGSEIDQWIVQNLGPGGHKRKYRWRSNWGDINHNVPTRLSLSRIYWLRNKEDLALFLLKWA